MANKITLGASGGLGTATPAQVIEGATFTSDEGIMLTGEFVGLDTSDATATADNILDGQTAYVAGELVTGSMPNNGAVSATLSGSGATYTIPAGYHDGMGVVTGPTYTAYPKSRTVYAYTTYSGGSSSAGQSTGSGCMCLGTSVTDLLNTSLTIGMTTDFLIDINQADASTQYLMITTKYNY